MPIIEARAIPYENMLDFKLNHLPGIDLNHPTQTVKIISILDHDLPRIFEEDTKDVITLVFPDADPRKDLHPTEYTNKDYCTPEQAKQMVYFIEDAHRDPRNVLLLVNCKFGMCRSGAVVDYAGQVCQLSFWEQKHRNPQIVPNYWVRHLMFDEFYTKDLHC